MANGAVPVTVHVQVLRRTTAPVTGAGVTRLQHILNTLLLGPLAVDGQFGPKTEAAVKKFQQNQGLVVDGVVGALTWAALLIA
ncbi:MAG: peptidoglycan-binding domain-containing protein, partial [Acidimicrobiales bacterium]